MFIARVVPSEASSVRSGMFIARAVADLKGPI